VGQLHHTMHQNSATDHTSEIVYVLSELRESTSLSFKKINLLKPTCYMMHQPV